MDSILRYLVLVLVLSAGLTIAGAAVLELHPMMMFAARVEAIANGGLHR